MSRVITDGIPVAFRDVLLRLAKRALNAHNGEWEDWVKKYPNLSTGSFDQKAFQCDQYFFELRKQCITIDANMESQYITMARIALDRRAPLGERQAAASAFFKFAYKHNMTAEAIVSITHPPKPEPQLVIAYMPETAEEPEASKKDWYDSIWGRVVAFVVIIAFTFLAGIVMFPIHTLVAPGEIETHYSVWGGLIPWIYFGILMLAQGLLFVVLCAVFYTVLYIKRLVSLFIRRPEPQELGGEAR